MIAAFHAQPNAVCMASYCSDTTPGGVLNTYAQPGGVFTYRAPGGVDLYIQP